ncbi:hypothetical protein [Algoriphagus sp.]|uniref:hypothetical protein n=1 Tax=Algoriphagus sp. TaxID=1872435 RepID=UPI003270886B
MISSYKNIRRTVLLTVLCVAFILPPTRTQAAAAIPIVEIIKAAVKKVIVAVDLQIQRQQNKVIWLQNAQKVLENTMSKLKLDEISSWTEKQRELYKNISTSSNKSSQRFPATIGYVTSPKNKH